MKNTLLALAAALPLTAFAVTEAVASKGNAKGEADYLLILGHALENDTASEVLINRCNKAAEYLKEHKSTIAIACGGITGENQTKDRKSVV